MFALCLKSTRSYFRPQRKFFCRAKRLPSEITDKFAAHLSYHQPMTEINGMGDYALGDFPSED